jgi:hypothetical protein
VIFCMISLNGIELSLSNDLPRLPLPAQQLLQLRALFRRMRHAGHRAVQVRVQYFEAERDGATRGTRGNRRPGMAGESPPS